MQCHFLSSRFSYHPIRQHINIHWITDVYLSMWGADSFGGVLILIRRDNFISEARHQTPESRQNREASI